MTTIKKTKMVWVVVSSDTWEKRIRVDSDVFSDVLTEACTRVIENNINKKTFKLPAILQARLEEDDLCEFKIYNVYKLLMNASLFKLAEKVRGEFFMQYNVDLSKEPLHSK